MPLMRAGEVQREIDCVILDKDGTLIDYHSAWFDRYNDSILDVVNAAGGDPALRKAICHALAIDNVNRRFIPDAPNASLPMEDHALMVATLLHQTGIEWQKAEALVEEWMMPKLTAPIERSSIRSIGNISERLVSWASTGVKLAVVTNDNRASTIADLQTLGIDHLLAAVVSADEGLAAKPAPDGVVHVARSLDVPASRLAMIGDTATDLMAARSAGAGMLIGVRSGLDSASNLATIAHAVVQDLHAVELLSA